jgi:MFS family permease
MFKRMSPEKNRTKLKLATANIILVANAFIWYLLAFNGIKELTSPQSLLIVIGINTGAIVLSGLLGTFVVSKFKNRRLFLYLWLLIGIGISIVPLAFNVINSTNITIIALIFGLYFGIGMPATMGYHSSFTNIEGRAKIGGLTFLIIGVTFAITGFIAFNSLLTLCIILATVRIIGLIVFHLMRVNTPDEKTPKEPNVKYRSIIQNKSFILYFIPWLMISLVNFLTVPIQSQIYASTQNMDQFSAAENVVIAIVAVFSGFIADRWGRKRLTIIGFIMLGIGYAVIGLSSANQLNMLLPSIIFTVTDGVAWGIFYVLFLFTLWGDISQNQNSDKLYFLGALPYISSYFMKELFISLFPIMPLASTLFSFASVFLFLAVLPLVYAPETLPEKVMKDRDLKTYVENAKKKAQKDAEKTQKEEKPPNSNNEEKNNASADDKNYEDAAKLAEKYY